MSGLVRPEDVERLRRMYENLRGAPGISLRKDREAIRRVLAFMDVEEMAEKRETAL